MNLEISQDLLTALDCRDSLHTFMAYHWDVLEQFEFVDNWHLHAICDHVQATIKGDINNLIINMPPRHGKSWTCGIAAVPWTWLWSPGTRFLYCSYGIDLAKDHAVKSRDIISSNKYQNLKYALSSLPGYDNWGMNKRMDTNLKYGNTMTGERFTTAVTARTTGFGGHCIIADDLQSVQDAESENARKTVKDFWDKTLSSRQNNPKKIRKILIMHRLHTDDITQHVLDKSKESGEHWEHLVIPARYIPDHPFQTKTCLGFEDPRTERGQVLWQGFYDEAEVKKLEVNMGTHAAAGQLDQLPVPEGGGWLKEKWFKQLDDNEVRAIFDEGRAIFKAASYDTAWSDKDAKESAYTARVTFVVFHTRTTRPGEIPDYRFLITDYWKDRIETPDLLKLMWEHYEKSQVSAKPIDNIIIEKKANGIMAYQSFRHSIPIVPHIPKGEKGARVHAVSPFVEAGMVFVPKNSHSIQEMVKELSTYPNGREKDTADAFSQGLHVLINEKNFRPQPFCYDFVDIRKLKQKQKDDED